MLDRNPAKTYGMSADRPSLRIDEEKALFFRARRTHLAGSGALDSAAAARSIVGAQAQQENPALFALSLRTAGRPTAAEVRSQLLEEASRHLVRTWGQRDTLHVYDRADWPTVIAALPELPQSGRRGGMPTEGDLAIARSAFERAKRPLLRRELFDLIPQRYLDEVADHPGAAGSPERLAATRLIWCLAKQGEVLFAHKQGTEQAYVHRERWLPNSGWPDLPIPCEAATLLARRYLGSYAPATPADVAHFFGSKVSTARTWLERLEPDVVDVECGDRRGLVALAEDVADLDTEPSSAVKDWPVRLLPLWDTHTMTHKDKSWVVPRLEEAKLVWRKAGMICPTVLARGRFVATWSHRASRRLISVSLSPLSGWRDKYLAQVKREARALAAHLEVPAVEVEVVDG